MSLQSNYGGFLQALDVSDQRMEEIVDSLISQIAENNRARREIIEENVGNPEGRRSIRRELFALNSPRLSERPFLIFWMRQNWKCSTAFRRSVSSSVRLSRAALSGGPGQPRGHRYSAELISACQDSAADRILHGQTPLPR